MTLSASAPVPSSRLATFNGIVRADGRVATRNYIGIFVVGNCGATVARKIADWFTEARLTAWPGVDGVVPFVHEIGCGMEMTGEPMNLLRRTIAGTIRNPNIAGALVIALGCERNNIDGFLEQEKLAQGPLLKRLVMQELGGTQRTIELGIAAVSEMLPLVANVRREPVAARHLTVGLQADPDDEQAAATASPALGAAMDLLVAQGGTVILSGTAGIAPVAAAFQARAEQPAVGEQLAQRVQWWHGYSEGRTNRLGLRLTQPAAHDQHARLAEANARRAGSAPLQAVYEYAQPVVRSGLVFMDTPIYEAVSATGQIAGGATLICVATGTGSGFGALPATTIKLAASSALYAAMEDDLDVDCGAAADGPEAVARLGQEIFARLLRHASGDKTKAEELALGENEFVPWPIGVLA
ncbi:UxaA family hydrolase [Chitinasiproducens palmae]|uniref:Altronate hydrolase n=1 Tax=Chitinasiproducens palmae TaxID=1770053 RepID=A0A1H2PLI8_9BURK|nr:UxaA family hydrolase [Chitinasiproducens palmae]SDV47306.1 altronate hydrolase [Chitinasiproducens palmae]